MDYRKGDIVKLQGEVMDTGSQTVFIEGYGWIATGRLELVERPGPRLEDLPPGTVITSPASEVSWEVFNGKAWAYHTVIRLDEWDGPFTVIGAKPGTPAWDLWLAKSGVDYDSMSIHEDEWWRS